MSAHIVGSDARSYERLESNLRITLVGCDWFVGCGEEEFAPDDCNILQATAKRLERIKTSYPGWPENLCHLACGALTVYLTQPQQTFGGRERRTAC